MSIGTNMRGKVFGGKFTSAPFNQSKIEISFEVPSFIPLHRIDIYNGEKFDLYISVLRMESYKDELDALEKCKKVIFVTECENIRRIISNTIEPDQKEITSAIEEIVESLRVQRREAVKHIKVEETGKNEVCKVKIGDDFIYMYQWRANGELISIRNSCIERVLSTVCTEDPLVDYINFGNSSELISRFVTHDTNIELAKKTLLKNYRFETWNPWIIRGLEDCGFLHNNGVFVI